jgi:putative transposase
MLAYRSHPGKRRVHFINLLSDLCSLRAVCDTRGMNTSSRNRYKHHRCPAAISSHGLWLYGRFWLRYRDVAEPLFARGVTVSYEAMRQWCRTFGPPDAKALRHRQPTPGDQWLLEAVSWTIHGQRSSLWRAVAQEGTILDILVQRRRDQHAAQTFFRT